MFDVNGVLGTRRRGVVKLYDGVREGLQALLDAGARVGVWTSAKAATLTEGLRAEVGEQLWGSLALLLAKDACEAGRFKRYTRLRVLVGDTPPLYIVDDSAAKIADWPEECKLVRTRAVSTDDMFRAVHGWLARAGSTAGDAGVGGAVGAALPSK